MTPNADFTSQLMKAIQQTDEWDRIRRESPGIQAARSQLKTVMEPIESKELCDSILDASFELATACENAAMLYGLRVANTIRDMASWAEGGFQHGKKSHDTITEGTYPPSAQK